MGAGFDSTWFCLKNEAKQPFKYIEIDFHEVLCFLFLTHDWWVNGNASQVTCQKINVIRMTEPLAAMIDESDMLSEESVKLGKLITHDYCIVPSDLREIGSLEQALEEVDFNER